MAARLISHLLKQPYNTTFFHCQPRFPAYHAVGIQMLTEAATCRKYVVPKLQGAGWDAEPHSIAEQRFLTDGRIIVRGSQTTRRPGKKVDYLLCYTRDFPIAVVEAKVIYKTSAGKIISHFPPGPDRKTFYFDRGQEEIAAELVHELDVAGKRLCVVTLTDYTAEKVRTLCASSDELRRHHPATQYEARQSSHSYRIWGSMISKF